MISEMLSDWPAGTIAGLSMIGCCLFLLFAASCGVSALGDEMGFDSMTVQPAPGGDRFFYAEPQEKK